MTANEFIVRDEKFIGPLTEKQKEIYVDSIIQHHDYIQAMVDFAKYHVKLALEQAADNALIVDEETGYGANPSFGIDKGSILESYPLENIR